MLIEKVIITDAEVKVTIDLGDNLQDVLWGLAQAVGLENARDCDFMEIVGMRMDHPPVLNMTVKIS